jgi:hypothetical protein
MMRGLEIGCHSISDPTLPSLDQIKESFLVKEIRANIKEYRSDRRKYVHKQSRLFIDLMKNNDKFDIIYIIISDIYTIFSPVLTFFRSRFRVNENV